MQSESQPSARHNSKNGVERFCPHMGCLPNTTAVFEDQLRELLATRLRMAGVVVTAGLGLFLIRGLALGLPPETGGLPAFLVQVVITAIVAGLTLLLALRPAAWTIANLRWMELGIFGLTSAFLVWFLWALLRFCPADELPQLAAAYPARVVIPWVLLIQVYGLFIPNPWRRSAVLILLAVIIGVLGAVVAGQQQPLVQESLRDGGLSAMVLWLAIAGGAAVYGSHRFSILRRETFDARSMGLYTLVRRLGSGGMGEVYLAEHQLLKRPSALKLIRPDKTGDEKSISRFRNEVQATARLTHPNTIEIYDFGITQDGTLFYVMEYLPGMSLEEMVARFGPLPPERVVYLLRQVCSALGEAHRAGLIHRDIKPGNIFAAERGGIQDVAKLLDFGLVKSVTAPAPEANLTMDGAFLGSPLYAPPEMSVGDQKPDARSDIYSLGATAYHLLSGRPVFEGANPLKVIFAHANEPVRPLSDLRGDVTPELEALVMQCLAKDPDERFGDVRQLEAALDECRFAAPWDAARASQWWADIAASPTSTPLASETVTQVAQFDTNR